MRILSHRGFWLRPEEKNSFNAFHRSFSLGFGIETDIRDHGSRLVISHNAPTGSEITLEEMLNLYKELNCSEMLALNIKADGLQQYITYMLGNYDVENYFLFDMSVPDAIASLGVGLKCFTRQSEYEITPTFYKEALGVWLDEFYSDWITPNHLERHIRNDKMVAIVSPELHNRKYHNRWIMFKELNFLIDFKNVFICTDMPLEADKFINSEN